MNKIFKPCKYLLLIGLPCILVICLAGKKYHPEVQVYSWLFVIALSGLVGIGTNTIAIRMLFRPKYPTILGRQGLIPKNKNRIADIIGEQTEKKLLNTETLMQYIEKDQIIEQTITTLTKTIEDYLNEEINRRRIADLVLASYTEHADKIFTGLANATDKYLSEFITRQISVELIWDDVKPKITDFFESEVLKHKVAGWIVQFLSENVPEVSRRVDHVLNMYFESLPWWKEAGIKFISGFNKETVARIVKEALNDPRTHREIIRLVENNLINIETYLEKKEVRRRVEKVHEWIKSFIVTTAKEKAIPALKEKIDLFLSKEESWDTIDTYLKSILHTILSKIKQYYHEPSNIEKIKEFIPAILNKFNIKRIVADNIKNQDTEEFEKMIVKVSGENLAAIEVLGGFLGMLAGIAIKEPVFLIVLPLGIALFLGVEKMCSP